MIERNLAKYLRESAGRYPVVTVTGPRQSGKTTLCRAVFPDKPYVSLEPLDTRDFARRDPRAFLAEYANGAIVDEIQNVPELTSYLQPLVDGDPTPGRFVLTGSQHFALSDAITQSLAGRTAVLVLLPPSLEELRRFPNPPQTLLETLFAGAYPRIHDRGIPPPQWLADYVTTYVQRDVRQVLNVTDLQTFTTFLRLCAGRSAHELNLSDLGGDSGVTHNTARAWLSVLETSFLSFRLPAWHRNIRKQMRKTPKICFFDSGLLCHLIGIRDPDQLRAHPARGAIFESWVASEIYKSFVHAGEIPGLFHYRDARRLEVDLVLERADSVSLIEVKSGATIAGDFCDALLDLAKIVHERGDAPPVRLHLVYGGERRQQRSNGVEIVPWMHLDDVHWR